MLFTKFDPEKREVVLLCGLQGSWFLPTAQTLLFRPINSEKPSLKLNLADFSWPSKSDLKCIGLAEISHYIYMTLLQGRAIQNDPQGHDGKKKSCVLCMLAQVPTGQGWSN